jgi:hypothetical protein
VAVNYRTHPKAAEQTVEDIRKLGRKAVAIQGNIGRVPDAQQLVRKSIEALGSLDARAFTSKTAGRGKTSTGSSSNTRPTTPASTGIYPKAAFGSCPWRNITSPAE